MNHRHLIYALLIACAALLLAGCGPAIYTSRSQYPNGTPKQVYQYSFNEQRREVRQGPYEVWHENGQLKERGAYKDGKHAGVFEFFNEDGQLKERSVFKDGERNGLFERYWAGGALELKGQYIGKYRAGDWTFYYPSGQPRAQGRFQDDQRRGTWSFWTASGELHARVAYPPSFTDEVEREFLEVALVPFTPEGEGPRAWTHAQEIKTVITAHRRDISYCYERDLQNDRELGGKVITRFGIGLFGEVTHALILSSTMNSPKTEDCILRILLRMQFPLSNDQFTIVDFPFTFSAIQKR